MTSVSLGFCHPDQVSALFMQSVLNVVIDDAQRPPMDQRIGGIINVGSGPRIAEARNEIVSMALANKACTHLLMVDADMVFSVEAVDLLIDTAIEGDFPILGGLCFAGGRSGIMKPTLYRLTKPPEDAPEDFNPIETVEDYPPDAVCEVTATGAAFLLIRRDVLETMGEHYKDAAYPWFIEGSSYRRTKFGEDWAFCVRAKDLGFPVRVHTGAKTGHMKPQMLDEEAFLAYKAKKDTHGEAGMQRRYKAKIMGAGASPLSAPTFVVIPQKGKVHYTTALVKQLYGQGGYEGIFVYDNGSSAEEQVQTHDALRKIKGAELVQAEGWNLHRMWNDGVAKALEQIDGPVNVAILNNDLRLGPHFLSRLSTALRADQNLLAVCPNYDKRDQAGTQYVMGTWGMKGMSGFAFMIKAEQFDEPPFDEEFEWWYGDDDFAIRVGYQRKLIGLVGMASVEHLGGGSQTAKDFDLSEAVLKDRARFMAKHNFVERDDGVLVQQLEGAA